MWTPKPLVGGGASAGMPRVVGHRVHPVDEREHHRLQTDHQHEGSRRHQRRPFASDQVHKIVAEWNLADETEARVERDRRPNQTTQQQRVAREQVPRSSSKQERVDHSGNLLGVLVLGTGRCLVPSPRLCGERVRVRGSSATSSRAMTSLLPHVTRANTSDTLTDRARQAGTKLPANAVPAPIAAPHHKAASGTVNFGKNAMRNGRPPKTLLIT